MAENKITKDDFLKKDWLLYPLIHLLHMNQAQVILFICTISGVMFWGIGGLASILYTGIGKKITAPDNLIFMIAWVLIFVPLIWSTYLWQAQSTPLLISRILNGKSFGHPSSDLAHKVSSHATRIFNRMLSWQVYLAAFVVLLLFWITEFTISWPEQLRHQTEYWFDVSWYLPVHIFSWSISLFPLFIFVIRHVVFIIGLRSLFDNYPINVHPLDPDECGGLGEIGNFVKSSILVAIGLGFIAVFFGFVVYMNSSSLFGRPDVISLFGLYVALVPFSLVVPISSARTAMLKARDRVLAPLAEEFQEKMASLQQKLPTNANDFKEINEHLGAIQVYRETILRTYPTLPISLGTLQRFSISATLPLITGIASLVLQFIK